MADARQKKLGAVFLDSFWRDNAIFRQILGICSTLAVTNLVVNTVFMCLGLTFATAMSSATVSALRAYTPKRVRMMVQTLVIAAYVIIIDIVLKAYVPTVSKALGPYVGLIITNCIIMGRCEAFAGSNPPRPSFVDGLGSGLGYSVVLLAIAVVRELLGFGTILGFTVLGGTWTRWTIMVMPAGAFFMLGLMIWLA
ncbi:MAG TPA: Rnf-Nqr domain containing protein, partial [bacterium]|nr:Rnf-Nqr domain containing protein [bacterium]